MHLTTLLEKLFHKNSNCRSSVFAFWGVLCFVRWNEKKFEQVFIDRPLLNTFKHIYILLHQSPTFCWCQQSHFWNFELSFLEAEFYKFFKNTQVCILYCFTLVVIIRIVIDLLMSLRLSENNAVLIELI